MDKLAQLADRIMDVATPTVASVAAPQSSPELEQLRSEVAQLFEQDNGLVFLAAAAHPALVETASAGTIAALVTRHANVPHPAPSRETTGPVASGDEHTWPHRESPFLYYRSSFRNTVSRGHWCRGECYPTISHCTPKSMGWPHLTGSQWILHRNLWHSVPYPQPRTPEHFAGF